MKDDLADIAAEFSILCIGKSPRIEREAFNSTTNIVVYHGSKRLFIANDLNTVMGVVVNWTTKNNISLCISHLKDWAVLLIDNPGREDLAEVNHDNLCHALLLACVETARKL